ncbi:MAG: ribonuclease III family protein [Candidatus Heimdallarchaeota archaeon]
MDASSTNDFKLQEILLDKNLAKFGDAIVNYIYNAAVYEATEKLQGVKVWDKSLAKACRASPLRNLVGSKKNAGELGDAVEAFIGFLYIKKSKSIINQMIEILKRFIIQNWVLLSDEQEICSEAFTHLLSVLCNEIGIV